MRLHIFDIFDIFDILTYNLGGGSDSSYFFAYLTYQSYWKGGGFILVIFGILNILVIFVILNISIIFVIFCIFLIFAMHLTDMHQFVFVSARIRTFERRGRASFAT